MAVEVQVADTWILVPARPAADWLELLMGEPGDWDMDAIFPGLAEDPDNLVNESLWAGEITPQELEDKTLELISTVSGRPWYVAMRMIQLAQASWSVLGTTLLLHGIDAGKVSLSSWLDGLWYAIFSSVKKEERTKLAMLIEAMPAALQNNSEDVFESMEMTADQFTSLMRR